MGQLHFLILLLVLPSCHAAWTDLDRFQATVTRTEFEHLLATVYCPSGAFTNYLCYAADSVTIHSTPARTNALYTLRFAVHPHTRQSSPTPIGRIVLDPGHIGGAWARMEERFFVRGSDRPVQEAALNLTVARLLQPQLETAGFSVWLSKNRFHPVTDQRPEDFHDQAERDVPADVDEANRAAAVRQRAELFFFRHAEIAARAATINTGLKPDLTICLHFNAAPWDECQRLIEDNRLLLYIHGNYLPEELVDDVQKYNLLRKLLEGSHPVELAIAESIAAALAAATGLPPAIQTGAAVRVGVSPYVYARNLAANRLIHGPVVYLEPYYMNNRLVYQRLQLGDYSGHKVIDGRNYPSIFREYAGAVAAGLSRKLFP